MNGPGIPDPCAAEHQLLALITRIAHSPFLPDDDAMRRIRDALLGDQ